MNSVFIFLCWLNVILQLGKIFPGMLFTLCYNASAHCCSEMLISEAEEMVHLALVLLANPGSVSST